MEKKCSGNKHATLNPLRIELPSPVRVGVPLFIPFRSCARRNARNILEADKSLGNGLCYDVAVGESIGWKGSWMFWKEREVTFRDFRNFLEGSGIFIIGNSGMLWNIPRCPRMFQSIQGINNRGLFDKVDFTYRFL